MLGLVHLFCYLDGVNPFPIKYNTSKNYLSCVWKWLFYSGNENACILPNHVQH